MAAQQPPAASAPQLFTVLRVDHINTSSQTLTNAVANCTISGNGAAAIMTCRPAPPTAKDSYHFNTALVLDDKGTASVIGCRVTLVYSWCKTLAPNTPLTATVKGAHMEVQDGKNVREFDLVTSQNVGVAPQSLFAPPVPAVQAVGAPKTNGATSSSNTSTSTTPSSNSRKAEEKSFTVSGNEMSCASASSPAEACVTFSSDPGGADIYMDGKFVGNTPSVLTVTPGSHDIRIEGTHMKAWTRTLQTSAGSKVNIKATLEPQN